MARHPITPIRFTPDDLADLDALVQLCGCSRPDAIRQAVRWYRGFMQSQYDRLAAHHAEKRTKKNPKKSQAQA